MWTYVAIVLNGEEELDNKSNYSEFMLMSFLYLIHKN